MIVKQIEKINSAVIYYDALGNVLGVGSVTDRPTPDPKDNKGIFINSPDRSQTYYCKADGIQSFTFIVEGKTTTAVYNRNEFLEFIFSNIYYPITLPFEEAAAIGKIPGVTPWNFFAFNKDVDTGGAEIIGSFGGTFTPLQTAENINIESTSGSDSAIGTGARQIVVQGILENGTPGNELIVLNGVTPVQTVNKFFGVNRLYVFQSGSGQRNAGDITAKAATSGTTQAQIPIGKSVSQQLIITTGIGHNFNIKQLFLNVNKVGGNAPIVEIFGQSYSRVTQTFYEIFYRKIDTAIDNFIYNGFGVPVKIGGQETAFFTIVTDTDNTTASGEVTGNYYEF